MRIILRRLLLTNFKGVRSLSVDFSDGETVISGENGSGKTTIFDAVSWLLFDKDSSGATNFNIKTLDDHNRVISQIEHAVEGEIFTGYEVITLRKVLREKWQKKKGALEPEFMGNETLYFCNDVPLKQGEYKLKVDAILKEELFKLITSPYYFNSLKWQDRRNVLIRMAGNISDSEIAGARADFTGLLDLIGSKTFEEYKRELAVKKRKLQDELKMIPTRVDELERSKPEAVDFAAVEDAISQVEAQIASIDGQISDRGKLLESFYGQKQRKQEALSLLQQQRSQLELDASNEAAQKNREQSAGLEEVEFEIKTLESIIKNANEEFQRLERDRATKASRRASMESQLKQLRQKWEEENSKVLSWNESDQICPCCHRPFEASDVESKKQEMLKNFNEAKNKALDEINDEGVALKRELEQLQVEIDRIGKDMLQVTAEQHSRSTQLKGLKEKVASESSSLKPIVASELLASNPDYIKLKYQIEDMQEELDLLKPSVDAEDLKQQRAGLLQQLEDRKKQLSARDLLERVEKRIRELKEEERGYAQQVADLEKSEFVMQEFTRAKIDAIETKINGLFSLVKFKMFETQINGGEVETCQCLVDGVPYSDLNTASKINAGLDIINALSRYYQVSAPIFVDGRESVNRLLPVEGQLINLVVSKEPLTITHIS